MHRHVTSRTHGNEFGCTRFSAPFAWIDFLRFESKHMLAQLYSRFFEVQNARKSKCRKRITQQPQTRHYRRLFIRHFVIITSAFRVGGNVLLSAQKLYEAVITSHNFHNLFESGLMKGV